MPSSVLAAVLAATADEGRAKPPVPAIAAADGGWAAERGGYRQPAACRAFGSGGTVCMFAMAIGIALWVPHSPVARIMPSAPLAVTFELAPVASAPPAQPVDVPPGPERHEQEASSEARPKAEPKTVDLPIPIVPLRSISGAPPPAPSDRAAEQASADAPAVERTTAPPVVPNPGAAVAARVTSASAEQAALANWQSRLLGHLKRVLRYPRQARSGRQEGVALVTATVDRQGKVLSARLNRGSGYPMLDSEAVATVRRASPVPPPTEEIRGDPVVVTIPIQFSLRG